ncbi:MAG: iron ABC transporter permease [Candidatus Kapaibacteriales bacterium]
MALVTGAVLAVCGACLQGLFRNPLADPGLIGASSGASLGAVVAIVLFSGVAPQVMDYGNTSNTFFYLLSRSSISLFAFLGSLVAIYTAYRLATTGGVTSVATLLLAGIAVSAIASAGYGIFISLADDQELRSITFWSLGSVAYVTWKEIVISMIFAVLPSLMLLRYGNTLNLLTLGEKDAFYTGVNVQKHKKSLIVLIAIAVGTITSLAGIIAFAGIVAPHLTRILFGADYKRILPLSMLMGGILVSLADLTSRVVIPPAELPLGILTTAVGGPFFVSLLLGLRKKGRL